jgi:hypothetical protein
LFLFLFFFFSKPEHMIITMAITTESCARAGGPRTRLGGLEALALALPDCPSLGKISALHFVGKP